MVTHSFTVSLNNNINTFIIFDNRVEVKRFKNYFL